MVTYSAFVPTFPMIVCRRVSSYKCSDRLPLTHYYHVYNSAQSFWKQSSNPCSCCFLRFCCRITHRCVNSKISTNFQLVEIVGCYYSLPCCCSHETISRWIWPHMIVNFFLTGPLVFYAFYLGYTATVESGLPHFSDPHMVNRSPIQCL